MTGAGLCGANGGLITLTIAFGILLLSSARKAQCDDDGGWQNEPPAM